MRTDAPQWFATTAATAAGESLYVEPRPKMVRFDDSRGTAYAEGELVLLGAAGEPIAVGDPVTFDPDGIIWRRA